MCRMPASRVGDSAGKNDPDDPVQLGMSRDKARFRRGARRASELASLTCPRRPPPPPPGRCAPAGPRKAPASQYRVLRARARDCARVVARAMASEAGRVGLCRGGQARASVRARGEQAGRTRGTRDPIICRVDTSWVSAWIKPTWGAFCAFECLCTSGPAPRGTSSRTWRAYPCWRCRHGEGSPGRARPPVRGLGFRAGAVSGIRVVSTPCERHSPKT